MQIIGQKKIDDAHKKHSGWRASLRNWTTIVKGAEWTCNNDIQQTFNTADPVGKYVVFNIAGNQARLAAVVNFEEKLVIIKEIVSHAVYDRKEYL